MRPKALHGIVRFAPLPVHIPQTAPPIDAAEQKQPHHVDEVPIPSGRLESHVLLRSEVTQLAPPISDAQEERADNHMEAVEARRQIER